MEVAVEVLRWRSALDDCGGRASCRNTYGVVVLVHVASELLGGGTLGIVKSPVCNHSHNTTVNHGPLSALHNLMHFSFLHEGSWRRMKGAAGGICRPRSEAPCIPYGFYHVGTNVKWLPIIRDVDSIGKKCHVWKGYWFELAKRALAVCLRVCQPVRVCARVLA